MSILCLFHSGIAYGGLQGRTLFPMACSTAARSGMKIVSARSFPSSLQFLCCQKLRHHIPGYLNVVDTISMPPGLKQYLNNRIPWMVRPWQIQRKKQHADIEFSKICYKCWPLKDALSSMTSCKDSDEDKDSTCHMSDYGSCDSCSNDDLVSCEDGNDGEDDDSNDESDSEDDAITAVNLLRRSSQRWFGSCRKSATVRPEELSAHSEADEPAAKRFKPNWSGMLPPSGSLEVVDDKTLGKESSQGCVSSLASNPDDDCDSDSDSEMTITRLKNSNKLNRYLSSRKRKR